MEIIELNNKIKELEKIIENYKYQITNNIIYQCIKCKSITQLDKILCSHEPIRFPYSKCDNCLCLKCFDEIKNNNSEPICSKTKKFFCYDCCDTYFDSYVCYYICRCSYCHKVVCKEFAEEVDDYKYYCLEHVEFYKPKQRLGHWD